MGVYANDKSKTSAGKVTKNVTMAVAKKPVVVPAGPKIVNGA